MHVPTRDRIPVWIDCDPGYDDACAIIMAAYHPSMDLLGISTVFGNTSLAQTTQNTLSILELIGKSSIPVIPGAAQPRFRRAMNGEYFHSPTGLEGTDLLPRPGYSALVEEDAIDQMYRALKATSRGTAWLVAIGPLTNIALLLLKYLETRFHIKGLSIMGGVVGNDFCVGSASAVSSLGTTWDPVIEFNILCDPETDNFVFSGNPELRHKTVLIPLDLSHQVCITGEVMDKLCRGTHDATRLRLAFYQLLAFYDTSHAKHSDLETGAPLHDPLAVAAILADCKCSADRIDFDNGDNDRWNVEVVLRGKDVGRLVVTRSNRDGILIPKGLDVEKFWSTFNDCMERADEATGFQCVEQEVQDSATQPFSAGAIANA